MPAFLSFELNRQDEEAFERFEKKYRQLIVFEGE